ncbi:hypothetical protein WJX73_004643 [Symbiochloris irregularis]|uniref:Uncharacterized protein n=1 Tax=Symbiochloris irregularis TaxID=706552 RepID=A0AAW1P4E3_9CHLO
MLLRAGQQLGVGSEYGEGFLQYKARGTPERLDVDTLNERLRAHGPQRLRQHMRPDEALAAIICWDGVITDMKAHHRSAWHKVAAEEKLAFPGPPMERHVFSVSPEQAITQVLHWTTDAGQAQRLAWLVAAKLAEELRSLREPAAGVRDWLAALASSHVQCALVAPLDRASLGQTLDRMGLVHAFQARVSADDGMDTRAQCLLSAALQLNRPPNRCVVFDASPAGITAAHNCTMKAVAVLGPHPAWKLHAADLTCSSLEELTVYNMRRLFANTGHELMDVCQQHQMNGAVMSC